VIDVPELLAALEIRVEKKSANRLWAVCPSPEHNDHDPSWFIWNEPGVPRHGKHRCYGCGFRGGPTALVREVLGGSWDDAAYWLETGTLQSTPLTIQVEVKEARAIERVSQPDWVRFVTTWEEWPTLARRYLASPKRRMGPEVWPALAQRWGLGFIAKGDRELVNRIWLPIRDTNLKLMSWQARTYVDDDVRYTTPHHVATPILYGAEHWPEPEDRRAIVVVEGPFDALSVDRATRLPVGAVIGSNPAPRQLIALSTFKEVVVMSDADPAGDKLADALVGLGRWTTVTRVRLADGSDPGGATDETLRSALAPWL
jgi:DNA primase